MAELIRTNRHAIGNESEHTAVICRDFAGTYVAAQTEIGCGHLPIVPTMVSERERMDRGELEDIAHAVAEAAASRPIRQAAPCPCRSLPLTTELGRLATAFLVLLSTARDTSGVQERASAQESFTTRLATVQQMTSDLMSRRSLAGAFLEGRLDQVFRHTAKAGCVHAPAALYGVPDPIVSLAALERLHTRAWRTHHTLHQAVYRPSAHDGRTSAARCCGALPAATSAALVELMHRWCRSVSAGYAYAVCGVPGHFDAMTEQARDLFTAACALGDELAELGTV